MFLRTWLFYGVIFTKLPRWYWAITGFLKSTVKELALNILALDSNRNFKSCNIHMWTVNMWTHRRVTVYQADRINVLVYHCILNTNVINKNYDNKWFFTIIGK